MICRLIFQQKSSKATAHKASHCCSNNFFFPIQIFRGKAWPDLVPRAVFLKIIYHSLFCLFNFIQKLICPDLSHPISLIGGIIPHLSYIALFHLRGHSDVNLHFGITIQETSEQNINVKKFDIAYSCLSCVIVLQRSFCHMVCLQGQKKIPYCLLNCLDDTTLNSFSFVVFSNTWAANNVGVLGHELQICCWNRVCGYELCMPGPDKARFIPLAARSSLWEPAHKLN